MTNRRSDYRNLVHTPAELGAEYIAWAEKIQADPGIKFGVSVIDRVVIPMRGGELISLIARPGHGKCFAPGTMVLMYDGTVKPVEQVQIGDRLVGPDSQPRTVIGLGSGEDEMYTIVPVKGNSYTVNSGHILSVVMSSDGPGYSGGQIFNVSIDEYFQKTKKWRHHAKGYRAQVDWPSWPVPIEPYFVGLWLGDGTQGDTSITTADEEVVEYLNQYAERLGLKLSKQGTEDRCPIYNISVRKGQSNPIRQNLRKIGIFDDKRIPHIYKINDREVRLNVLAGLVDSDGSYYRHNLSITQKRKNLADDIAFLARSLGFAAYVKEMRKVCTNNGKVGTYYRVHISGNLSEIPTRIKRKQMPERRQVKDVLRTGIRVKSAGIGEYFGFGISGPDKRFLLADFTVVHNTSLLAHFTRIEAERIRARGMEKKEAVVYVTWEQSAEELEAFFQADGTHSISDIAWGRADLDTIKRQAMKRASLPIWVIGHGIGRVGKQVPRMTPEIVLDAIESMASDPFYVRPTLMVFDYMQLIPVPGFSDRIQRITEVPIRIKELALRIGCPAIVGVQARREVDDRSVKIPGMRDAQWASSIEQTSDKIFGLWRPCITENEGDIIDIEIGKYTVSDRLLIIRMLKQRGDRGRYTWGMYFAPEYLKLAEMEKKNAPTVPTNW